MPDTTLIKLKILHSSIKKTCEHAQFNINLFPDEIDEELYIYYNGVNHVLAPIEKALTKIIQELDPCYAPPQREEVLILYYDATQ